MESLAASRPPLHPDSCTHVLKATIKHTLHVETFEHNKQQRSKPHVCARRTSNSIHLLLDRLFWNPTADYLRALVRVPLS